MLKIVVSIEQENKYKYVCKEIFKRSKIEVITLELFFEDSGYLLTPKNSFLG